jgi:hypothetical protein
MKGTKGTVLYARDKLSCYGCAPYSYITHTEYDSFYGRAGNVPLIPLVPFLRIRGPRPQCSDTRIIAHQHGHPRLGPITEAELSEARDWLAGRNGSTP